MVRKPDEPGKPSNMRNLVVWNIVALVSASNGELSRDSFSARKEKSWDVLASEYM